MNIPMSWLRDYVDLNCDCKTFVDKMTMSGSKVEGVTHLGQDISGIVVGKVMSVEKHPNADKLFITKVNIGTGAPIQIVTGATNLCAGAIVPVALDGATLAGGVKIQKGSLRGEVSDGMLCSIEELGYTQTDYPEAPEHGIYIFQDMPPLGSDVVPLLELADDVVEFEITSNRSDCYSVFGIAREAAATFDKLFRFTEIKVEGKGEGDIKQMISVEIKNPDLCPRYIARVVKNVKIGPSPQWLRHRLTAAGIRPINNIVDITNYVMLEIGQPMHAFDINCIAGRKIIVRNANEKETFTTLDGEKRKLDPSMLVIADCEKAVAIAGVMGGENSMITETANTVLFESANFNGTNIRLTSKKLGLRTDSSGKYEKGLDPNLADIAVNRAVQLVEQLNCGEVVGGMVDNYPRKRKSWMVNYSVDKINKLLGTDISDFQMTDIFTRLEIVATSGVALIPTFRPDIECEADLAEEVARLYGYNRIKATLAVGTPTVGKKNKKQIFEDIIKNTMVALGYSEALTYAFESPKVFDKLRIPARSALRKAVVISNPLGEDYSVMRTTTLNGILSSLAANYNKRNDEAALFELAKTYTPKALPLTELPVETDVLTLGMYGKKDFYNIKGAVEGLAKRLGVSELDFSPQSKLPFMHPGRTAVFTVNKKEFGYLGEVHPAVLKDYGIETKAYIAVVYADILFDNMNLVRTYNPVAKFPAIKRDIAMLVKEDVMAKDIENAIKAKGGEFIESVRLFDVYKGEKLQEGYKSVAYSISFRSADRTLTDDEVAAAMKKILANLEKKLGAQLRS